MAQISSLQNFSNWNSQTAHDAILATNQRQLIVGNERDTQSAYVIHMAPDPQDCWSKTYANGPYDAGFQSIAQLADGTYLCAGYYLASSSSDSQRIWLVNIDDNGNVLWQKNLEPVGYQASASSVVATSDGGFAFTAWMIGSGSDNVSAVYKFDSKKSLNWQRIVTDVFLYSLRQNPDGSYVASGRNIQSGLNSNPVAVILDGSGNVKLKQVFTSCSVYVLQNTDALRTSDGNYVIAAQAFLVKFNPSGTVLWQRNVDNGYLSRLATSSKGELLVGGAIVIGDVNSAYVALTDSNGLAILWDDTALFAGSGACRVMLDSAGRAWAAGNLTNGTLNSMCFLALFNPVKTLATS
ncbi:MAG TPA: hypothetical protein VN923_02885 [Thermoanaerobaculia bacterium]|nr:hypothetical protein [Thermoanaerobaculia bacterium]